MRKRETLSILDRYISLLGNMSNEELKKLEKKKEILSVINEDISSFISNDSGFEVIDLMLNDLDTLSTLTTEYEILGLPYFKYFSNLGTYTYDFNSDLNNFMSNEEDTLSSDYYKLSKKQGKINNSLLSMAA